jgi:MSHA biogenesis protein MshO
MTSASRTIQKGVTLIELIMVIAIMGICAAALGSFILPSIQAYIDVRNRASLTSGAQSAIRSIVQDVHTSVSNSLRTPNSSCIEAIPTSSGGSYRIDRDSVNDAPTGCNATGTCSATLDTSTSTAVFDTYTVLATTPSVGDFVVINNQVPSQVYNGTNRAAITAVGTPRATDGVFRLSINSTQFPLGYADGRFVVVPVSQGPVTFVCDGADGTVDANGDGKGTLYRRSGYGFNSTFSSCPTGASLASASVIAKRLKSCTFSYSPNQGSTQQNGYLSIALELTRNNESVSIISGAHVDNAP